ncbi:hypothetical protein QL285_032313 [Trifolium repens]|nr:hypothetical protein QL285_032313 [Trifolium repens]
MMMIIVDTIALESGNANNDFELIKLNMLRELSLHRATYLKLYESEKHLNHITYALYPPKRKSTHSVAPMDKWFTVSDMGHIAGSHYNKVVVELTKHEIGVSKSFFPLRGSPPGDLSS